jgi:uncharacterized protein
LTDDEYDELSEFLAYEIDSDEQMMIDGLDGYLHAIAIGPTKLHPTQWLPKVWGTEEVLPPTDSPEELARMVSLIGRHLNSIIVGLESNPRMVSPSWGWEDGVEPPCMDAEGWAMGFVEGVRLCWDDWQPLLNSPEGQGWIKPIGLLGVKNYASNQRELTRTPQSRDQLARQIPEAVLNIYAFWRMRRLVSL